MNQLAALLSAPAVTGSTKPAASRTATAPPGLHRPSPIGQKRVSQRDVMREIHSRWKHDPGRMVREYAEAERQGKVQRKRNKSGLSAEEYARALLADAAKKGWLG